MAITNGYATLAEVKAALRIPSADTMDDALIETAIEAASRDIDAHTERNFYNAGTAARLYVPTDSFLTEIDDAVSVSKVESSSDGTIFDIDWNMASDVQLEPLNGITGGLAQPYTRLRAIGSYLFPVWDIKNVNAQQATVRVTAVWGWATVPRAIKQATILYAARQFKRYDSPLGVAGFGDLGAINITRIDPDVLQLIGPFRKIRMA